jgi:hypothetical protein
MSVSPVAHDCVSLKMPPLHTCERAKQSYCLFPHTIETDSENKTANNVLSVFSSLSVAVSLVCSNLQSEAGMHLLLHRGRLRGASSSWHSGSWRGGTGLLLFGHGVERVVIQRSASCTHACRWLGSRNLGHVQRCSCGRRRSVSRRGWRRQISRRLRCSVGRRCLSRSGSGRNWGCCARGFGSYKERSLVSGHL